MARDATLSIGVLNIAMHAPHPSRHYIDLFTQTYRERIQATARGDQQVLIGALDFVEKSHPEKGITGELYRYSRFDSDEPWFNINNREEASEDELKQIRIPDHLKPHFSRFPFVFFPKGHRLYIEFRKYGKVTSPQAVATAFQRLFDSKQLANFGKVEVTVQPAHNALQQIFKIPYMRTLKIELVRPNPDDHGSLQGRWMKKLEKQKASKMDITLSASRDDSLVPDEETKAIAAVAALNGYVCATGKDAGGLTITRSTKDIPLIEKTVYDSDLQSSNEVLFQTARRLHSGLAS